MRIRFATLLLGLAWCAMAVSAERLALVIGNSQYPGKTFASATNSALSVAKALEGAGFVTTTVLDADRKALVTALQKVEASASHSAFIVIYYAGRVRVEGGRNFLVPARGRARDLARQGVGIAMLGRTFTSAGKRQVLVLVDPLPELPGAGTEPDLDSVNVVIAAAPRQLPVHRDGKSVFGAVVGAALAEPGLTVAQFVDKVRSQVAWLTGRSQQPWTGGLPGAAVVLNASQPGGAKTAAAIAAPDTEAVKGGCYEMGSSWGESGRNNDESAHQVCVTDFRIGAREVTVAEFRRFVESSRYVTDAERNVSASGCWGERNGNWGDHAALSWRDPGFAQDGSHPVVCVSWNDASAYVRWLSARGGVSYRLPTEAEWEYAARAGTSSARYWGDDADVSCRYANLADQAARRVYSGWTVHACDDGAVRTSAAGRYAANAFGLHDMLGNVWEWTCSAYDGSYGGGERRCANSAGAFSLRGGSWDALPKFSRAAARHQNPPWYRSVLVGFRIARE